jgi:flagellar basal-body rod protein FlgF
MDELTISAASGMRARMDSLEMLANNLANAATSGYKSDREFYSLYVAPEAGGDGLGPQPSTLPVIERHWTDLRQGTLTATGNALDLAISGTGFFAADGPSGRLYTRNGSFRISRAEVLTTADGYPLRTAGGEPVRTVSAAPVEVSAGGVVRQSGQVLGQLSIVTFDRPDVLVKAGGNYFQAGGAVAAPATGFEIHQGKLESSNVAAPESAVRLISLMRQFEMLQKAVSLGGEMNRRAIEEVARANP